jgi:hypothetical protein
MLLKALLLLRMLLRQQDPARARTPAAQHVLRFLWLQGTTSAYTPIDWYLT